MMMSKQRISMIGAIAAVVSVMSVASAATDTDPIGLLDGRSPVLLPAWLTPDSTGWRASEVTLASPYTGHSAMQINMIPTPGSVALAGLAGVAMLRRRRGDGA